MVAQTAEQQLPMRSMTDPNRTLLASGQTKIARPPDRASEQSREEGRLLRSLLSQWSAHACNQLAARTRCLLAKNAD
jgi:hypothetical protein